MYYNTKVLYKSQEITSNIRAMYIYSETFRMFHYMRNGYMVVLHGCITTMVIHGCM